MPRKSNAPAIQCEFFTWRLFRRDGVFYADGRGTTRDLGKHSLGTRDQEDALQNLRRLDLQKAIQLEMASPTDPAADSRGPVAIDQGWDEYLEHCGRTSIVGGVSPNTLKRYRAVRARHVEFCGRRGIGSWNDFNERQLKGFAADLERKYAPRSIVLALTLVKSVVGWFIDQRRLPETCRLRLRVSKPTGTDTYCYSPEEVTAMLNRCWNEPKLVWLGDVILILSHTGMRIGEVEKLRWGDIDFTNKVIQVADERSSHRKQKAGTARTAKGKRSRTIPLHPKLITRLQELPRHSHGYVLCSTKGSRIRQRRVLATLKESVIEPLKDRFPTPEGETGFEHGTVHSFRHFFCSQALVRGAKEGEVREWLGHSDSKMVEHYRHLLRQDAQRRMNSIDFLGSDGQEGDSKSPSHQ